MAVRIYKSTDPGAPPPPSATRGSMSAIIRACLVTGYGSGEDAKAPAGWEEPFSETNNCAVFRALQGTARQFYQINDQDYDADVTRLTSYDSMSDALTGMGERGSTYLGKRYGTTTGTWFVVADEKTCYVEIFSQDNYIVHGFGEYKSLIADDPCPAFVAGHADSAQLADDDNNIPLHNGYVMSSTTWQAGYLRRSISADTPSSFQPLNYGTNSGQGISNNDNQFSANRVEGVDLVVLPVVVKAIDDVTAGIRQPCGILRGLYAPMFLGISQEIIVAGGRDLFGFSMDAGGSDNGKMYVDITGPWD